MYRTTVKPVFNFLFFEERGSAGTHLSWKGCVPLRAYSIELPHRHADIVCELLKGPDRALPVVVSQHAGLCQDSAAGEPNARTDLGRRTDKCPTNRSVSTEISSGQRPISNFALNIGTQVAEDGFSQRRFSRAERGLTFRARGIASAWRKPR